MKKQETRIKKWMKYREEILENKNIRKSLLNTNKDFNYQYKKLSSIFHNIDFLDNQSDNFMSRIDSIDLNTQNKIIEIDEKLEKINNKERIRSGKNNYNSGTYNSFIKKYFTNEYNKKHIIQVTNIVLEKI